MQGPLAPWCTCCGICSKFSTAVMLVGLQTMNMHAVRPTHLLCDQRHTLRKPAGGDGLLHLCCLATDGCHHDCLAVASQAVPQHKGHQAVAVRHMHPMHIQQYTKQPKHLMLTTLLALQCSLCCCWFTTALVSRLPAFSWATLQQARPDLASPMLLSCSAMMTCSR